MRLQPKGEPVRVLRIVTRLAGGPPNHIAAVTSELGQRGFQTLVVHGACEHDETELREPLAGKPGIKTLSLPSLRRSPHPLRDAIAFLTLVRIIAKFRPSIVHTHMAKAGLLGRLAAFLMGVPVIVHTYHGHVLSEYYSRWVNATLRSIEGLLARLSTGIFSLCAQQQAELRGLLKFAQPSKIEVVPLGMNLSRLQSLPPVSLVAKSFTVGWIGRMAPIKDLDLLCASLRRLFAAYPDAKAILAGDGPEIEAVKKLQADYPRNVLLPGWVRDVKEVIERCDVIVLTSKNEGTPVALIQGMAGARPFVSTRAGGVTDMVTGEGHCRVAGSEWFDNGVLADRSAEAISAAMIELAAQPELKRKMGIAARRFATERFSLEAMTNAVQSLYLRYLAAAGMINLPAARPVPAASEMAPARLDRAA